MPTTTLSPTTLFTVHGIARDRAPADHLLHALKEAGFGPGSISLLFLDRKPPTSQSRGRTIRPAPESSTDIRGIVASLDEVRSVMLPSSTYLIVAGPLGRALKPAQPNAIAAALMTFGVLPLDATRRAQRAYDGAFLVGVHTENSDEAARAQTVFREQQAELITQGGSVDWAQGKLDLFG